MGLFYTGKGDQGHSQVGQKKVPKNSPIFEGLGDLDELNSLIGLVRSGLKDTSLKETLKQVQEILFIIQAQCALVLFPGYKTKQLPKEKITALERKIDAIEETIKPKRGFVIPGEEPIGAQLDYVRAVARRAERAIDTLHKTYPLPPEILAYMNRLSSYLYALARYEAFKARVTESKPTYQ